MRVLRAELDPSGRECQRVGLITVSIKDRLGFARELEIPEFTQFQSEGESDSELFRILRRTMDSCGFSFGRKNG